MNNGSKHLAVNEHNVRATRTAFFIFKALYECHYEFPSIKDITLPVAEREKLTERTSDLPKATVQTAETSKPKSQFLHKLFTFLIEILKQNLFSILSFGMHGKKCEL